MSVLNTHNVKLQFGQYEGELYTRVPFNYLVWMVSIDHQYSDFAEAEIARRGGVVPDVEITAHAVDRASIHLMDRYYDLRESEDEGLHRFLCRMTLEALKRGGKQNEDRFSYKRIIFIVELSGVIPVLKTVFPALETKNELWTLGDAINLDEFYD